MRQTPSQNCCHQLIDLNAFTQILGFFVVVKKSPIFNSPLTKSGNFFFFFLIQLTPCLHPEQLSGVAHVMMEESVSCCRRGNGPDGASSLGLAVSRPAWSPAWISKRRSGRCLTSELWPLTAGRALRKELPNFLRPFRKSRTSNLSWLFFMAEQRGALQLTGRTSRYKWFLEPTIRLLTWVNS